jgi:hypothetical protein
MSNSECNSESVMERGHSRPHDDSHHPKRTRIPVRPARYGSHDGRSPANRVACSLGHSQPPVSLLGASDPVSRLEASSKRSHGGSMLTSITSACCQVCVGPTRRVHFCLVPSVHPVTHREQPRRNPCARRSIDGAGSDARKRDPLRSTGGGDRTHEASVAYLHRSRSPTRASQTALVIGLMARRGEFQPAWEITPTLRRSGPPVRVTGPREDSLGRTDELPFSHGLNLPPGAGTAKGRCCRGSPRRVLRRSSRRSAKAFGVRILRR